MRKWKRGVRLFGNPPQEITRGVFVLVDTTFMLINRQKGLPDDYHADYVLDHEALLTAMQDKCNTMKNPAELLYNTHPKHRPAHAPPLPTATTAFTSAAAPPPTSAVSRPLAPTASTSAVSQPLPPTAPTASTSAAPPPPTSAVSRPLPPTASTSQPLPPTASTSAGSSARTPQKRRNADQNNGPSPKRTREESSDSSVEPDSPIPGPVHHQRRKRPVRRRNLFGIDASNCVVNRTRAAPTPTELYQEPEQANWGRNGTEAVSYTHLTLPTIYSV